MKALITGTNRGIGFELCRQLAERGDEVVAICRQPSTALTELAARPQLNVKIVEGIDITNQNGIAGLVEAVKGDEIDLLINNAGVMEGVSLDRLDIGSIHRQFTVNAVAPLQVTHAVLGQLSRHAKVAIVTSRMGSIDDNDSGGSYGYRMSKVAANMAGRSLSVDLKGRGISVALLHPGWVRTDMTGGNGLIDADESARGLIAVMDRLDLDHTGLFWHTNGEILPW
jgi:NAD(P)-dependent dehydrogenase (short-subunit alcohol dehydrogenase family)